MDKEWLTGSDLMHPNGKLLPLQLFDLLKKGWLTAYTELGKKIVDADTLEHEPIWSKQQIARMMAGVDAAGRVLGKAGSSQNIGGTTCLADIERTYNNPSNMKVVNLPPNSISFSFTMPPNRTEALKAVERLSSFLFDVENVRICQTEHSIRIITETDRTNCNGPSEGPVEGMASQKQPIYTPLPGEKPLKGYRAIAKKMGGVKSETVEKVWRKNGAPIVNVRGHVEAYESCLNQWQADWGKGRKKKTQRSSP
ncbi:MAG: hypothetical protein A4E57_03437 [Syntrophorhabdaceae bacterium PtaU1.Bin034]|jgi:hypothetical protein|nr:MAG: hypothetical protein A4E57_03437 [Syntrophorhabdaceae bacterium PtaU1.Bin034]